jgi:hypothetical protein
MIRPKRRNPPAGLEAQSFQFDQIHVNMTSKAIPDNSARDPASARRPCPAQPGLRRCGARGQAWGLGRAFYHSPQFHFRGMFHWPVKVGNSVKAVASTHDLGSAMTAL